MAAMLVSIKVSGEASLSDQPFCALHVHHLSLRCVTL